MPLQQLPCISIIAIALIGCTSVDSSPALPHDESENQEQECASPFGQGEGVIDVQNKKPSSTKAKPVVWRSQEARFDEELEQDVVKSKDLNSDVKLMWKTVPHDEFPVSPVSAINAASRVFESVQLKGKTKAEVFAIIGNNKTSNDSGYNFPFWEANKDDLVYRFDCGNFGWQFNLEFNGTDRVTEVKRLWIH